MSDLDTDSESAYFFHVQFRKWKDNDGKLQRGGIYLDSTGYGLIGFDGNVLFVVKRRKRETRSRRLLKEDKIILHGYEIHVLYRVKY